jgi:hypothetical protein
MKAYLKNLIQQSDNPLQRRNLVREYLQACILGSLQRVGAMIPLALHGGTALRFLYALPRYSEDLAFTLERAEDLYDLRAYSKRIQADLQAEGYTVEIKLNERQVVLAAVRFPGLLYELGLSSHREEVIVVKVEVDTRPPGGAGLAQTLVRRHETLQLQHHDRATLLAGKIHAVLQRAYTKGRDLYDLFWYLSDPGWPAPNLILLNNALNLTGWEGETLTEQIWKATLLAQLEKVAWEQVAADVRPFMEREADVDFLVFENFRALLQ